MVDIASASDTIISVAFWFLVIILVGGSGFFVWWWTGFKHQLELREVVNNRKIIAAYRWKERKDKKGNTWLVTPFWNVNKRGLKLAIPPNESIELTKRGKKKVLGWVYDGNVIWAKDDFNFEEYKKDQGVNFQPLDTTDRELLVNELEKSKEYEGKNVWAVIAQLFMMLAPIILIIVIALTLGDITKALGNYANTITRIAEDHSIIVQCDYNTQSIEPLITDGGVTPPPG